MEKKLREVKIEQENGEFVIELPKECIERWRERRLKMIGVGPFLVIGPEEELEKFQFNVIERKEK